MSEARSTQWAVIGGGIVGAAIAYGLARAGAKPLLLDEGDVAHRAARGNLGNVWVQGKGAALPPYADLSRRAANDWAGFADELREVTGVDVHFRRPGAFFLCFSPEELEKRGAMMARLNDAATVKSRFEVLEADELRRRLPAAGQALAGAIFSPDDGTANPLRLLRALIQGTVLLGGKYLPCQRAESITVSGGGVEIATEKGPVRAERVVLAAGLGNARLAPLLGLDAPVRPVRGQILVTEKVRPFLDCGTNFVRQTVEGGCVFGESSEEVGFDEGTTLPVLRETAIRAVAAFPLLRHVQVVRAWGALRIMSPDGAPIYQQTEDRRAFLVSVHSGVTLSSFHAGPLVETLMAEGFSGPAYRPFSPERFHVQAA
ncbi:glycine/D-amino acid oxidase-like deaminating enzyme [Rhodopseudomonas julia]|uniref:Glycine/D-amino acid oxidase-like deaminating enzyme n=1 Tax=Rhodopseudomonas julia TaxID=200617 RepID=A0ABU0C6F8_9BRAD|nr:FAD-dependent oxidoreductase [Rhodopseudomonas julia]MDQ0324667.1 glycine/D-amino acid oxidase-like deaminating enzyme [Rhodopseudomonas julia]